MQTLLHWGFLFGNIAALLGAIGFYLLILDFAAWFIPLSGEGGLKRFTRILVAVVCTGLFVVMEYLARNLSLSTWPVFLFAILALLFSAPHSLHCWEKWEKNRKFQALVALLRGDKESPPSNNPSKP